MQCCLIADHCPGRAPPDPSPDALPRLSTPVLTQTGCIPVWRYRHHYHWTDVPASGPLIYSILDNEPATQLKVLPASFVRIIIQISFTTKQFPSEKHHQKKEKNTSYLRYSLNDVSQKKYGFNMRKHVACNVNLNFAYRKYNQHTPIPDRVPQRCRTTTW